MADPRNDDNFEGNDDQRDAFVDLTNTVEKIFAQILNEHVSDLPEEFIIRIKEVLEDITTGRADDTD